MGIKHATQTAEADDPAYDVSADEWNEDHTIDAGTIVNADINANAAIAYSKLATSPRVCRIATGQYTGDGTTSKSITGVGFQPKFVQIWNYTTTELDQQVLNFKSDQESGTFCVLWASAGPGVYHRDNRILSLDSDGFTVSDDGADLDPNKLNQVYNYLVLG